MRLYHQKNYCALALVLLFTINSFAQISADEQQKLEAVVLSYHQGFISGDSAQTAGVLSDGIMMFNGNASDDPLDWQAHLYFTGDTLHQWVKDMITYASPHENKIVFLNTHIRNGAAVVVTAETGSNKFRSWKDEKVVYLLGKTGGRWKLTGFFIRDAKNPE